MNTYARIKKGGELGMRSALNMKTDSNIYGTDNAALVQTLRTGSRRCTPADRHIGDTQPLFQFPSYSPHTMNVLSSQNQCLKKGKCGRSRRHV